MKKKELKRLKNQMNIQPERAFSWVGIRPTVFQSKKNNPKRERREGKLTCRQYDC